MKPKKPTREHTPVFDRGHWMKCPGFEGWICGRYVKVWKATMCPACVNRKRLREMKNDVDSV